MRTHGLSTLWRPRALAAATAPLAALLVLLAAVPALAQVDVVPVEPEPQGAPATKFTADYHHQFETHIDSSPGKFSRDSVIVRGMHDFKMGDSVSLIVQGTYQGHYYDFNKGGFLSWTDEHQGTLAGVLTWKLDDHWSLLGGGIIRSSAEGGAHFSDSLTGGGGAGFVYQSSPDFRVGFLLIVLSQIEDSAQVAPLPVLDWKFADHWKLHLGLNQVSQLGYGGELSYAPSESWDLQTGFSYERMRFRLANSGANSNGVAEEHSLPVYLRVTMHPSKNMDLSLLGDVALGGNLRVETKGGSKIQDSSYNAAPGVSAQFTYRF